MFPVDSTPIEHGIVTVDGGRVVDVGTNVPAAVELQDIGDVALLPGLVNAHTHLEFSHLRQPLGRPGMPLADWIRLVIAERQRRPDSIADAIASGLHESTRHGVTTIGEITTSAPAAYASAQAEDLTLLSEVIGFSLDRASSALAATEERLTAMRRSLLPTDGATTNIRLGISPHAPYTVSLSLLSKLVVLAGESDLPMAMHVAESADERELLSAGTGPFRQLLEERSMWDPSAIPHGTRALDYLRILADAPRALVIHGNYLDAEEQAYLADRADRMSLVYCPRTHAYFGHEPYPLADMLNAGVRVALGTDSRASNPDLSILGELRDIARRHPRVAPSTVLRLGTLSGAEALGRQDHAGSLTPGKPANLVAVPLPPDAGGKPEELLDATLHADDPPCGIWLGGRRL